MVPGLGDKRWCKSAKARLCVCWTRVRHVDELRSLVGTCLPTQTGHVKETTVDKSSKKRYYGEGLAEPSSFVESPNLGASLDPRDSCEIGNVSLVDQDG